MTSRCTCYQVDSEGVPGGGTVSLPIFVTFSRDALVTGFGLSLLGRAAEAGNRSVGPSVSEGLDLALSGMACACLYLSPSSSSLDSRTQYSTDSMLVAGALLAIPDWLLRRPTREPGLVLATDDTPDCDGAGCLEMITGDRAQDGSVVRMTSQLLT